MNEQTSRQDLHVRQTLHNLKFQVEEEVRLAAHEYQCARLLLIESRQKLNDITYLLEKYDDDNE